MKKGQHPERDVSDAQIDAMNLYAEGKSMVQISAIMGKRRGTLSGWKMRKLPSDWDQARSQRVQKKVEIVEERALETYDKVKVRHQYLLKNAAVRLAKRIVEAKDADITVSQATEGLMDLVDKEREIFLELDQVIAARNPRFGFAAQVKPTGEIGILASLNQAFEERHGKLIASDKRPDDRDPTKGS